MPDFNPVEYALELESRGIPYNIASIHASAVFQIVTHHFSITKDFKEREDFLKMVLEKMDEGLKVMDASMKKELEEKEMEASKKKT